MAHELFPAVSTITGFSPKEAKMSWTIDNAHSQIQFAVRHMMISNVHGGFEKFSGTIDFDENDPVRSLLSVQIEGGSLNTKEPKRDEHLRSVDFFNVAQYPYMTYKSKRMEQADATHGRIIGDLTIRDVTREVILDVEYAGQAKSLWGTVSAGFNAQTKINRQDWNLNWNKALETGGVLVGDEIKIDIELEVVQQA
jgi:polyisoprenoid-binding protein YceI